MSDKEVKRAACDPGWNDPPLFSFDHRAQFDQQQQQAGKRTSLNKRVVFPSTPPPPSSGAPAQTPPRSQLLGNKPPPQMSSPPPPPPASGAPPPTDAAVGDLASSSTGGEEISLTGVMDNFEQALLEAVGPDNETKSSADVLRRFQTMKTMWQDEKFDSKIKEKILRLSEALKTDDLKKADMLQQSLMVDHPSLCSSWMSGIRNVLMSKRANTICSESNPIDSTVSQQD